MSYVNRTDVNLLNVLISVKVARYVDHYRVACNKRGGGRCDRHCVDSPSVCCLNMAMTTSVSWLILNRFIEAN